MFDAKLLVLPAAACLLTLNILLAATLASPSFKLWPVPSRQSWQSYTFWPLFRSGLGLTLVYAILTVRSPEAGDALRFAVGLAMVTAGFGFTIYGYFDLGIENTYGADDGLVTGGLYKYSRNPQYVASILGFSGVAVAHWTSEAGLLCGLAVLVYVLLPFTEEPWLETAYGEVYAAYRKHTPRFL